MVWEGGTNQAAYSYASQYEMAQESLTRKTRAHFQANLFTTYNVQPDRIRGAVSNWYGKEWWDWSKFQKCPYGAKVRTGSVFFCGETDFPGHQFTNGGMHMLEGLEVEGELDWLEMMKVARKKARLQKHWCMPHKGGNPNLKSMRFKEKKPIFALLDNGSRHSFLDPSVLVGSGYQITRMSPGWLTVIKRVKDTPCKALLYSRPRVWRWSNPFWPSSGHRSFANDSRVPANSWQESRNQIQCLSEDLRLADIHRLFYGATYLLWTSWGIFI